MPRSHKVGEFSAPTGARKRGVLDRDCCQDDLLRDLGPRATLPLVWAGQRLTGDDPRSYLTTAAPVGIGDHALDFRATLTACSASSSRVCGTPNTASSVASTTLTTRPPYRATIAATLAPVGWRRSAHETCKVRARVSVGSTWRPFLSTGLRSMAVATATLWSAASSGPRPKATRPTVRPDRVHRAGER